MWICFIIALPVWAILEVASGTISTIPMILEKICQIGKSPMEQGDNSYIWTWYCRGSNKDSKYCWVHRNYS